ncbi:cytochrome c oxidase subunit I [Rhodoplanes sp. TEM]|uniref:cytochrome-c oxidase n=1 Tax=Rhodoplanes tepidamans TaxID=200616 RepID=A0ABT5J6I3_RHOTP|nr:MULTISPECIES: cytochrome c oxidase subunit I [Rhodoplanes]MDC7785047.1 cytochrome c oxidase subunit I [Rhodoplanes tepidamans]MDC7982521.1 cytochrome c oxidase subunit I [Rhodoplanes sp. TEM]MDQ0356535.1 cytochrome c oxidase subunit I+III [Rhodoplanes tepidamans]
MTATVHKTPRAEERTGPAGLPNPAPRPEGEIEALKHVWRAPKGLNFITVVNNTYVGLFYVGTAFLFFILAGILALIMRTQLAVPQADIVSQGTYNQLFTMHGTMMMFLFAVPAVEAMGVYLLPNMQAARDLPFPRLSAYAFWAYFFGGLAFFCSLLFQVAPDTGWFMYPPLTGTKYSPGINADFWLLGIGFIEISAIAGAIEIIVGVLKTRAPGMSLDKLPVYAWAMLVFAALIVFAFPAVILCTLLLEIERAFGWPFFIAEKGGSAMLWQHLFWFFGHPEVYIIFLPAAGMVSMMVPTIAQTPLVGYRLVVLAIVATGFFSFGVWVHHMFATGIPQLSLSFFSAASMAVSVPSGIQVFAWIATIANGRLQLTTPALFILGFLFIFTLGGLTGVMVGMVPFDWQVHDTYFVVAHFHYVLIGGMVFPLFAAFYYWTPLASRKPLSEKLGRWVFGLMFVGMNVTFFPMHLTGLIGMPRRVYTYPAGLGWDWLNMTSTIGAFMIAAGVALFLFDLVRRFRITEDNAGNIWNAGTLEWLPSGDYANRSIPRVTSREPLWDQPHLAADVEAGRYYLPNAPTGGRETIVTSPITAEPQYVVQMPGPSWATVLGAFFTAAFFILLTVKLVIPAIVCAVIAVGMVIWWLWDTDPGPAQATVDIGGGIRLPTYVTGPMSHSWWAMVVLLMVAGTLYACLLFSYLFLWTVSPDVWPKPDALPELPWPLLPAVLYAASSLAVVLASRSLRRVPAGGAGAAGVWPMRIALAAAIPLVVAAVATDLAAQSGTGLQPTESAYGAVVYMFVSLQGFYAVVLVLMGVFTLARSLAGKLDGVRRGTFDNTMLLWHFAVVQGLVGLAVTALFPRLVGG